MKEQDPFLPIFKDQKIDSYYLCLKHGGFIMVALDGKSLICTTGGEEITSPAQMMLFFGKNHPPL